jgi:prolipoprotein diacylglyceryltransferase/protein-S-isoprenylcysteine O-methyltransferase Ste14
MKIWIGKTLYALLFLLVVPLLLWFWAIQTEPVMKMTPIRHEMIGLLGMITGGGLIVWAMIKLKTDGKGLPMNAYPPKFLVTSGPYSLVRHPIYVGFGMLLAGISVYTGSASGLWLVTPVTILGMIALVMGYESIDLQKRFPAGTMHTYLDLSANTDSRPVSRERLVPLLLLAMPVIGLNTWLLATKMPMENMAHTAGGWQHIMRETGLLWTACVVFLLPTSRELRTFCFSLIISMSIVLFRVFFFPALSGWLYNPNTKLSIPGVILLLGAHSIWSVKRFRLLMLPLVSLFVIEWLYSHSPVVYGILNLFLFLIASQHVRLWSVIRRVAENIANSWQEWTIGKIRIINHGLYAGAAAFTGILLAGMLAGKAYSYAILVFAMVVTVFAAIWAQVIEGSDKLKRPFGYYGGLVGILIASLAIIAMGLNAWVVIALFSVAMPWVQAIGRLRCLVNGCCHGKVTNNEWVGIRYFHPRTRVCHLSAVGGVPVHPTQVYSIVWLTLVGFVQLSVWFHQFPYSFIFGMYLILTSLGRFVEEAYRGEVQTPIIKGMRLYQWTAIVALIVGLCMTMVPVPLVTLYDGISVETFIAALLGGLFLTFCMGVDFPYSTARFSRLV